VRALSLGEAVKEVGMYAFTECDALETVVLNAALKKIGIGVFSGCGKLVSATFAEKTGWAVSRSADMSDVKTLDAAELEDSQMAAKYLTGYYYGYYWAR
jgi:hypothetical protein